MSIEIKAVWKAVNRTTGSNDHLITELEFTDGKSELSMLFEESSANRQGIEDL